VYYIPQIVLGLIWLVVVGRIGSIASEHFRCPKCNQSIWLDGGEYALNPKVCPKCGIALK
jgi:Zn-finger nucleic acid-binding protein